MPKLKPLADYVVAKQVEAKTKTASGIILPDSATEKPKVAIILEVGKDVKEVETGNRVIYKQYGTVEVKYDGEEYILIKEEDILAKVNE